MDTRIESLGPGWGGWGGFGGGCGHSDGFGMGGGLIGGLLLGTLLRGGGFFGGGGCDRGCGDGGRSWGGPGVGQVVLDTAVLQKLGTIEAAVPLSTAAINANTTAAAVSVKDNIQNQTLFQSQAFSNLALSGQQSFSNLKDSVQAGAVVTNASISNLKDTVQLGIAASSAQASVIENLINQQSCAIKQAINADGDQTRALINALEHERLRDQLNELRHDHRSRGAEINISQQMTNIQAQAQAQQQQQQQQQQMSDFFHRFNCFTNRFDQFQFQNQRATAGAVQFGTGNVAAQTPTNTQNQVGGF